MSLDLASLSTSLYNRAATDSAGAATRALLGGASSLFKRQALAANSDSGNPSRPSLPWLIYDPGDLTGPSGAMRDLHISWWMYANDPDTLDAIASALDSLYGHTARYAISGARVSVSFIGSVRPDATLGGLLGREVRVTLTQRG